MMMKSRRRRRKRSLRRRRFMQKCKFATIMKKEEGSRLDVIFVFNFPFCDIQ
jgi:hypothetical protein